MARCIDSDHGIGDHLCAEMTPVIAVQFDEPTARALYREVMGRYETIDQYEKYANDQIVPEAVQTLEALERVLATLQAAADSRGWNDISTAYFTRQESHP